MQDRFGRNIRYLRLSVTELCNLRCGYCMPPEGVCKKRHEQILTEEEMLCCVEAAAALGFQKVRITGGEPLVKKNILSICERVARVPGIEEVCITTNGADLAPLAKPLKEAGVRRVNLSLDTLDRERFLKITGRDRFDDVMEGLQAALLAGFERIKVNAVLLGGVNEEDLVPLAELTKRYPLDVRFIERMPLGDLDFGSFLSGDAVLSALPELIPAAGERYGVAEEYTLPGALGRVGLIRAVSRPFCSGCDRLRVTADGKVKPCLHSPEELNIKGLSRAGMESVLRAAIEMKPENHGGLAVSGSRRSMDRIGG